MGILNARNKSTGRSTPRTSEKEKVDPYFASEWYQKSGNNTGITGKGTTHSRNDKPMESTRVKNVAPSYFESDWYKKGANSAGITGKVMKKADMEKKNDPTDNFMKLWSNSEQMANSMANAGIHYYRGHDNGPNLTEKDDFSVEFKLPNVQENIFQLPQEYFDSLFGENANKSGTLIDQEIMDYELPKTGFRELDVAARLVEKLEMQGIAKPTPIQDIALPMVIKGKNIVFQSETGSGKTLVFLLPALQDPGKAYGTLIMVPTRELVSQITFEAHRLLRDKSIVASFVSGVDLTEQEKILSDSTNPPRVIIATPKRLWEIVKKYTELFSKTKRIIVDEVDKILLPLPKTASKYKQKRRSIHPRPGRLVVEALQSVSNVRMQLIATSATVDDLLLGELEEMGWGHHIQTVKPSTFEKKTKKVPDCIKHKFVVVDELNEVSKASMLARLFRQSKQTSALVFIYSTSSVDDFMWELRENGIKADALYKHLSDPHGFEKFLKDFQSGKTELIVANEETVRGLDFPNLEHVYLMEVPKDVDHYVHLAGRVGRQGLQGTCTTFVSNFDHGDMKRLLLEYAKLDLKCEEINLVEPETELPAMEIED